jgi:chromatin segregation and condensation protein Rec8/ScpA/Scc1 (kleisin family)
MVVDSLKSAGGRSNFFTLLGTAKDRATAIGVFCALLELCRRRVVSVSQAGPKDEIEISIAGLNQEAANDADLALEDVAA